MRPFVFRWQRMLRLAKGFERDRRHALATAIGELTRAENILNLLRRKRQELMEKRSNLLAKGAEITIVQDNYRGEVATDLQAEYQVGVVAGCQDIIDKRRGELTEKMRERKTYEKLRERAWERYAAESGREEIRIVDDIATISFERSRTDKTGEAYEG